jgi:hypothetical protein
MATAKARAKRGDASSERQAAESLYPGHRPPVSQPIPEGVELSALEAEIRQADSLDSSERLRLLSCVRELAHFHLARRAGRA